MNFKAPTSGELAHDYLWRIHEACPPRGILGVMNRSHYEDVVTARLSGVVDDEQCERRIRHIQEFERMLTDEGTAVVKVFLHISKDEQRFRLRPASTIPGRTGSSSARPRDPQALGRLPAALRRRDRRHVDRVGAVECGAGRPQVGATWRWRACWSTRCSASTSRPRPEPGIVGLVVE